MELHTLKPAPGAIKKRKRIGRGQGSGKGGTATKGHNGAQSRSGYKTNPHREGGQMPLQRRIPKFGFTNPNRKTNQIVTLTQIENIAKQIAKQYKAAKQHKAIEITPALLLEKGIIQKGKPYKILNKGTLNTKVNIIASQYAASVKAVVEEKGGTISKPTNP